MSGLKASTKAWQTSKPGGFDTLHLSRCGTMSVTCHADLMSDRFDRVFVDTALVGGLTGYSDDAWAADTSFWDVQRTGQASMGA